MTRFFVALSLSILWACNSPVESSVSKPAGGNEACTPEAECTACATCFDGCLCGGGTAARCAESCNARVDGGTTGDSGAPAAPFTATLVTDAFDVPAGEEYFRCQNFANPFGRDIAVLSTESFMTAGSHHMFVFLKPGAEDGSLEECGGLEFSDNIHLSQRSQQRTDYPPGVGRFVSAGQGFRVQIHYLNVSTETVHAEIAATIRGTEPEAVPVHASGIFINTFGINVDPLSNGSADNHCTVPKDVNVFTAASHMHKHGVHFVARDDEGQLLYETNEWAEPEPWLFKPPRQLKAGTSIHIHCDYKNDSSVNLSFGESAASNEMCIFAGSYFPAADGESITCLF